MGAKNGFNGMVVDRNFRKISTSLAKSHGIIRNDPNSHLQGGVHLSSRLPFFCTTTTTLAHFSNT